MEKITALELASKIDHTVLKSFATSADIETLCREAIEYSFASVCVNPIHIKQAAAILKGEKPEVCTVIGFPLGSTTTGNKALETEEAVQLGATEIDMVLSVGAMKEQNYPAVLEDIKMVVKAAGGNCVKVILENCYLTPEEIAKACLLSRDAGADFVKTSTGFGTYGARVEDVELMRQTVPSMKIKAAGGIRDLKTALAMIAAGADRIGASAGLAILDELKKG